MSHLARRITNIFFAFLLAVMSVNLSGVLTLSTAQAKSNNGTLQVHEKGSPDMTPSNQPHVCVFNFEAFGLDANQTGNVTIESQSPTAVITPVVITLTTDANGNGATTPYVNDTNSQYTLADGHYKATLDNKFGTDNGDKAKSKVFWVRCDSTPATPATPTVAADLLTCSTKNTPNGAASIFITNTADDTDAAVVYTWTVKMGAATISSGVTGSVTDGTSTNVNLQNLAAGTYNVTITGNDGTSANTQFTIETCAPTVVPVTPATMNDGLCGTDGDTYTIPSTPNVIYKVNGKTVAAGTYNATTLQYITGVHIRAYAVNSDYTLSGDTSWDFAFSAKPCPAPVTPPTQFQDCGTDKDGYTIPSSNHIKYYVNGKYTPAGTYYNAPSIVVITAVADHGYVPASQAIWVFTYSSKPCPQPCTTDSPEFTTPLMFNNQRHHDNDDSDCIPAQPKDDTEEQTITETPVCLPNGGGTTTSWTEKRTRTYTYDKKSNTWVAGEWSDWTKVKGSETQTPASNEQCPAPTCPAPSVINDQQLRALSLSETTPHYCGNGGAGSETPKTPEVPAELPQTGPTDGNTFTKIATIVAAGILTYGAMFYLVNRRELSRK